MGKTSDLCPNGMDVTKLTHKKMLQTLENAVRFGKWVLLENVGEVGARGAPSTYLSASYPVLGMSDPALPYRGLRADLRSSKGDEKHRSTGIPRQRRHPWHSFKAPYHRFASSCTDLCPSFGAFVHP